MVAVSCEKGRKTQKATSFEMAFCVKVCPAASYSPTQSPRAVPSAQTGLASGFGMGPGVSLSLWPPKLYGDVNTSPDHTARDRGVAGCGSTVSREPHSGRELSIHSCVVKLSAY